MRLACQAFLCIAAWAPFEAAAAARRIVNGRGEL
jgi:hypothetical protein